MTDNLPVDEVHEAVEENVKQVARLLMEHDEAGNYANSGEFEIGGERYEFRFAVKKRGDKG